MRKSVYRTFASKAICLFSCLALCLVINPSGARGQDVRLPEPARTVVQDVFHYRMTGKVRVLFFWFGRDDVGGGHIAYFEAPGKATGSFIQGTEVLFGSDPDRVPGRVNRWGYGQELASWMRRTEGRAPCLESTVFEGFMRHSSEESISQVHASDQDEKSSAQFKYDGIVSQVSAPEAIGRIWQFSEETDFNYRNMTPVTEAYHERRGQGPPDTVKSFDNKSDMYSSPYGFLTGVRQLLEQVSDAYMSGDANWREGEYELAYAYNAKAYRLRIRKLGFHSDVSKDRKLAEASGIDAESLRDVAEAEFEQHNLATGKDHRFSVWFPLRGPECTIPLRVVDRPRWWLQVELNIPSENEPRPRFRQQRIA
jgi:hypothetical protein